jgi:hypothetical protein
MQPHRPQVKFELARDFVGAKSRPMQAGNPHSPLHHPAMRPDRGTALRARITTTTSPTKMAAHRVDIDVEFHRYLDLGAIGAPEIEDRVMPR